MTENATLTTTPEAVVADNQSELSTPVSFVKPQTVTETCEIVEISAPISGDKGNYHLVDITHEDGRAERITLTANYTNVVKDIQSNKGRSVTLNFQKNIAGKTQYVDKTSGEVRTHTVSKMALQSVLPVTKAQETALGIKAKFALLNELGLEKRITEANTDDKMALSSLYGSMMR